MNRPKERAEVIIDPNETWKEFFKSMVSFSDPKVIPVSELPKDFDPSKRRFQSLKSFVNWRNQNMVEHFTPVNEKSTLSMDLERNQLSNEERNQN